MSGVEGTSELLDVLELGADPLNRFSLSDPRLESSLVAAAEIAGPESDSVGGENLAAHGPDTPDSNAPEPIADTLIGQSVSQTISDGQWFIVSAEDIGLGIAADATGGKTPIDMESHAGGANVYSDDIGTVINLLDTEPVLPPSGLDFGLIDLGPPDDPGPPDTLPPDSPTPIGDPPNSGPPATDPPASGPPPSDPPDGDAPGQGGGPPLAIADLVPEAAETAPPFGGEVGAPSGPPSSASPPPEAPAGPPIAPPAPLDDLDFLPPPFA